MTAPCLAFYVLSLWLKNCSGNAAGTAIPGAMVSRPDDIRNCLLLQAVLAVVFLVAALVFMKEKPPTPPSAAAELRETGRLKAKQDISSTGVVVGNPGMEALKRIWSEILQVLHNRNFVKLAIAFAAGLGVFNTIMTLLGQITRPCGVSAATAGNLGATLMGAGLMGAVITGWVLELTKAYIPVLRVSFSISAVGASLLQLSGDTCGNHVSTCRPVVPKRCRWMSLLPFIACFYAKGSAELACLCFAGVIGMLAALRPGGVVPLYIAFGCMGIALLPTLPATLETAAEYVGAAIPAMQPNR